MTLRFMIIFLVIVASVRMAMADAAQSSPNIILIMADDLGYGELGCYGQEKIETPNIDRLAAQGMRFTQYYAGSAVCAPSRCVLMTGKHGGHAYIRNNSEVKDAKPGSFGGQLPIPDEEITMAEVLKQRGYSTGCFGKWGLGGVGTSGDPLNQGFDTFYGYNCQRHAHNLYPTYLVRDREEETLPGNTAGVTGETYAPQRIADEMLDFVRAHHDEPFFLYYPSVLPHLALQAPESAIQQYRGRWKETPYSGKSYQPHPTPRACYAAMISFLDAQVGRIMALLEELGLAENTVVIFTSDNGPTHLKEQVDVDFFQSAGGLNGLKGSLLEGGIRVPLIARWPGRIAASSESAFPSTHYDILPTLTELADATVPDGVDGVSMLPTLKGHVDEQKIHEYLLWDFKGYGGQIAVRMGHWKALRRNLDKMSDAPVELYDLETDPAESTDVSEAHPEIIVRMKQIMKEGRTRPALDVFSQGEYVD